MQIINPATEKIIETLAEDTGETLQIKLIFARKTQQLWAKESLEKRLEVIATFNQLLKDNLEELAQVLSKEVGKPINQARNEIKGARVRIKYFLENSQKYLKDELVSNESGMKEKISYEPLGVIVNISAWNYPYLVGVNVFIPALIAGNAVLYKPSEYSSLTGLKIREYLLKAGVPADVFQTAIGGKKVGERLLKMNLDGYFFTGSYQTGKYIYEKVAPKMVPCQLELGGKDPLYVADDIENVASAAQGIADGVFYNNGQSCCSVERIYVHEKIYDVFVDEFVKEVKSYTIGLPSDEKTYLGAITRKEHINFLEMQVADAIAKGAKLLMGGKRINRKGNYFEPTVFVDVNHHMSLMKDESFGPIIGIMKVKNDEEALKLMKDTDYGLTASVYSSDQKRAERLLKQINAGTGYWNCCDRVSAGLPWSGRQNSGFGATLSHLGIRAFVQPKAFHLKTPNK